MANKYLDNAGLDRVWDKIKTYLTNNYAVKSHTHTIAQITNLQTTLNGKANSSHTHTTSQITDLSSKGYISIGNKVTYNSEGSSYTLPASSVGVLIPCDILLSSSDINATIKAPSGGQYIVTGCYTSIITDNYALSVAGGAIIIRNSRYAGIIGFYLRIS